MNSLVRFGTDLLKFAAFAAVVYGICMSRLQDPIFHVPTSITHLAQFMAATSRKMFQNLIVVMAGVASIHYSWQKFDHIRQMKMSRQELKDELKQTEGDPLLKAKLKQMGIRLRQRQMLDEVPFADVVITNPTHFAVALRYLSGKDAAPVILAKGKDRFAQRIKSFASEYGVPMVENRPAAQALYKMGEVGKPIPQALFKVVANILGHVYREHRYYFFRLRARREARESGATQTYSPSSS
jgi:flagellar biosynthetic protein FlhB